MAAIAYLWKNRAKFQYFSPAFFKAWAKRIFSLPELLKRNYRSWRLRSAGAKINATAEIGQINAMGKKAHLQVGANSFLGKVELHLHENISIASNVCINDGAILLTGSHDVIDPLWPLIKKPIQIEEHAWIAINAMILPGVTIGKGAVVAAGAVVSKNVEAYSIVAGNPAKPIPKERGRHLTYNPCEFLADNLAWLKG